MLSSRERVNLALHHEEPDRVPLDLGGSTVTGMHVSTVYRLRQALRLDDPGTHQQRGNGRVCPQRQPAHQADGQPKLRGGLEELPDMARIKAMLRTTRWVDVAPDNIEIDAMVSVIQQVRGGRVRMIGHIVGEERPAFVVSMVSEDAFEKALNEEVDE